MLRIYHRRMFPYTPAYPNGRLRVGNTARHCSFSVVADRGQSIPSAIFKFSSRDMLNRTIKGHRYENGTQNEPGEQGVISAIKLSSKNDPLSNAVHYK